LAPREVVTVLHFRSYGMMIPCQQLFFSFSGNLLPLLLSQNSLCRCAGKPPKSHEIGSTKCVLRSDRPGSLKKSVSHSVDGCGDAENEVGYQLNGAFQRMVGERFTHFVVGAGASCVSFNTLAYLPVCLSTPWGPESVPCLSFTFFFRSMVLLMLV
jgi:hypothetical protein